MPSDSHPSPDSPDWNHPDYCPFCGAALADGGAGFIDHVDAHPTCKDRFEAWRERIVDDVDGEWSG
ncbi:MAG: hypothetical protein ABEI96_09895 [Haloarculaceae archaeon]